MDNQQRIADAMRGGQTSAIEGQQDLLAGMNAEEGGYRDQGYANADDLMGKTSGENLAGAQSDWNSQAAHLLDANYPVSGDSGTSDGVTNAALSRRAAEAATNIRAYGSKASQVGSYAAPLRTIQNAVTDSQTGIMPSAMASKLLQNSQPVLMSPSQTAWGNAGKYGEAAMGAAAAAGQSAQNIAGLQYQDSTDIANLTQADKATTAANIAEQAKADAAYKASMGQVFSSLGNLGLQGAGYYGKLPSFLQTGTPAFDMSQIP